MTVIKVETSERFSVSSFPKNHDRFFATQPVAQDPTVYEQIVYKCSKCKNEIEFLEPNFKKHSDSHFTNLVDKDKQLIDEYIKKQNLTVDSFLDFYCPTCNKPISVFYRDGYGGKHGEYIVSIQFVLELE